MRDVIIGSLKVGQNVSLKNRYVVRMKKKNLLSVAAIGIVLVSVFSGCLDSVLDSSTTYESHTTKITYTLRYGYTVECNGTGQYTIMYDCDTAEVVQGMVSYHPLYAVQFENITLVNNSFLRWNITADDSATYDLGIEANVVAESFLVSDLTGSQANTISEIAMMYPVVVSKYCMGQSNGSVYLIDPSDRAIQSVAEDVLEAADTTNSLLAAKELFIWLKENTEYKLHSASGAVQPARVTLERKTGDCDDLSFLYLSLCRAIGIPARFIRGYLLSEEPSGLISVTPHAWAEVFVGGGIGNMGWVPVECACDCDEVTVNVHQNFGVENAFHLRLFVDDGSNESLTVSLSGIKTTRYGLERTIDLSSLAEVEDYNSVESKKLVISSDDQRSYQS